MSDPVIDLKGHKSLAEMVSTHIHVWRTALQLRLENATGEDGEESYYEHELKALADIEAAVNATMENNDE